MKNLKRVPSRLVEPVMNAAREEFCPSNQFGVTAFGIAPKVTKGRSQSYSTLVAYVPTKRRMSDQEVPIVTGEYEGELFQVKPDIIAAGEPSDATDFGDIPFSGLHPGAAIAISEGPDRMGGVGCLLTMDSIGDDATHLVTAGHLFEPDSPRTEVQAAASPDQPPITVGLLTLNLLDKSRGDYERRDAALVELTAEGRQLADRTDAPLHLDRKTDAFQLHERQAKALLPTRGDFCRSVETRVELPFDAHMRSAVRPGRYTVRDVVQTRHPITTSGDSGTALFTTTSPRELMGVCIGQFRHASLFEPIERAIAQMEKRTSMTFDLWG